MLYSKNWNKISIFIILSGLLVFTLNAKSYDWSNISQEQYIDNLVDCKIQLQEYKWNKNHKAKDNITSGRTFKEAYSIDVIRQQVLDNLKMQFVLYEEFNTEITAEMLQFDIERMAHSTKDAESLKVVFAMFNNDVNTIAQCLSRPILVRQKIQSNYDFNSGIHKNTKDRAQIELQAYLEGSSIDGSELQKNNITFIIKHDDFEKEIISNDTVEPYIELSKDEFEVKRQQLSSNTLQEKDYGFIFSEFIEQSADRIKVKTLTWPKISFNLWIEQQKDTLYSTESQYLTFTLPKITGSNNIPIIKAGVAGDYWASYGYIPSARALHSTVWTGSEMIVWGGSGLNTGGRYDPITDNWQPTSTGANAPSGRTQHAAIWDATNNQMIIWGGFDGTKLNTGGRYDPNTDTWQSTSTGTNVPSGRYDHKAVWDTVNNQMIIWGGYDGTRPIAGGRYDPISDNWQQTSRGQCTKWAK